VRVSRTGLLLRLLLLLAVVFVEPAAVDVFVDPAAVVLDGGAEARAEAPGSPGRLG